MKKRSVPVLFCTAVMILCLSACGSQAGTASSDRDTFFQVSLLQGLTFGDYHGSVSVKDLKRKGDAGLGTFDGLDGEMIMLDGSVYKAKGGHVLGLRIEKADIALDLTDSFEMKLPDNDMFSGFDLTIDQSEDIKKVETDVDRK